MPRLKPPLLYLCMNHQLTLAVEVIDQQIKSTRFGGNWPFPSFQNLSHLQIRTITLHKEITQIPDLADWDNLLQTVRNCQHAIVNLSSTYLQRRVEAYATPCCDWHLDQTESDSRQNARVPLERKVTRHSAALFISEPSLISLCLWEAIEPWNTHGQTTFA